MLHNRRFRFRSSKQQIQRGKWLLTLFIILSISFTVVYLFERSVQPMLRTIATTEMKRVAQDSVTEGIKDISKKHDINKLMRVEKDRQGRVTLLAIHSQQQAIMYSQVSQKIQKKLKKLSDRSIDLRIGQLLQSSFFAEYGPKIPMQIWPKGASKISLRPAITSAGINTIMITLTLHIHTELGLVIPFTEESTVVDITYPLGEMFMMGEVPEYYYYMEQGKMKQLAPPPAQPTIPNH